MAASALKFTLKKASRFGWRGLRGRAYSSKKDFPRASAAYFEVTGRHGKVKTTHSDRVYYVLAGRGKFFIGKKEKAVPMKKSDVIIVPKNTPYDYRGRMKLFLVHAPAFDPKKEIMIK